MRSTILSKDDPLLEFLNEKNGRFNLKFNRIEMPENNYYFNFSEKPDENTVTIQGIMKCYLGHSNKFSNIIPQFLFVGGNKNKPSGYIPIHGFSPSTIAFFGSNARLSQGVDFAGGQCGKYETLSSSYIKKLRDNSHLFHVRVTLPKTYNNLVINQVLWRRNEPYIGLYHHTTKYVKSLILAGRSYIGSKWNIQGNLELNDSERAYFTNLNSIDMESDLFQIAMKDSGDILLTLDGFNVPDNIDKQSLPHYIKIIDVYRSSTTDRNAKIYQFVSTAMLKPQSFEFHKPPGEAAYNRISHPFIHSISMKCGKKLKFKKIKEGFLINTSINKDVVNYDNYAICSDCTCMDDIDSAYHEESPGFYYIIENSELDPLSFWKINVNSDQFTGRIPSFKK